MKDQRRYVTRHLIKLFNRFHFRSPVLDLGCGRGGVLITLAGILTARYYGIDTNYKSIITAIEKYKNSAANFGSSVWFNVYSAVEPYSVIPETILMNDVAEHVSFDKMLTANPGRHVYVSFPPWTSPFGGHQQTCLTPWRYIPWVHMVKPIWKRLLDTARNIDDLTSAKEQRITSRGTERIAHNHGYDMLYKRKWILRPELMRYGLPAIPAPRWVPDWMCMGAEYVFEKGEQ